MLLKEDSGFGVWQASPRVWDLAKPWRAEGKFPAEGAADVTEQ